MAKYAVNPAIFRAYDIRGLVERDLSDEAVTAIGQATGTFIRSQQGRSLVVGRDARLHSLRLQAIFMDGVRSSGVDVIDIGCVPTPVMAFAIASLEADAGAVITASHNPPAYNGVKLRRADAQYGSAPLSPEEIQTIGQIAREGRCVTGQHGSLREVDPSDDYCASVASLVQLAQRFTVVVDGGNGVAGPLAVRVLAACGADVLPLFVEPDGRFPNHHPDPSKADNLRELAHKVVAKGADLGLALDGDGDRVGFVDHTGAIVHADRALIVLAQFLLQKQQKPVVFDVMCSSVLENAVRSLGGEPVRCKTGYTNLTAAMRATNAVLGGERSGHIIASSERLHNYDDGIFAGVRLLEALTTLGKPLATLLADYPTMVALPDERLPCADHLKFAAIAFLRERLATTYRVTTLDGVRIDTGDGWGIVRASNTEPILTARFEARTVDHAQAIRAELLRLIELFHQQG